MCVPKWLFAFLTDCVYAFLNDCDCAFVCDCVYAFLSGCEGRQLSMQLYYFIEKQQGPNGRNKAMTYCRPCSLMPRLYVSCAVVSRCIKNLFLSVSICLSVSLHPSPLAFSSVISLLYFSALWVSGCLSVCLAVVRTLWVGLLGRRPACSTLFYCAIMSDCLVCLFILDLTYR